MNAETTSNIVHQPQMAAPLAMTPGETSAVAVAAQSKALVEARYVMALKNPRDMDVVRQRILSECKRPAFAHNKSAYYIKPIGKGVEGLGIRFVEAALRCMRNVLIETPTVYEDAEKRILRVWVTDLEANTVYMKDVTVAKTVERSSVPDGVTAISKRLNSGGKWTYLVPATDDDLLNKEGALVSKAVRTLGLRIIPGDIQDEAEALILKIRKDDAAKDPAATRKAVVDSFGELGITAEHLLEYLGHPLDQTTPDELVRLRGIYGALRDEETTWRAVMDNARENRADKSAPPAGDGKPPDAPDAGADTSSSRLKGKLKKEAAGKPADASAADPSSSTAPAGNAPDSPAGAASGPDKAWVDDFDGKSDQRQPGD